jgi:hypothetical protein
MGSPSNIRTEGMIIIPVIRVEPVSTPVMRRTRVNRTWSPTGRPDRYGRRPVSTTGRRSVSWAWAWGSSTTTGRSSTTCWRPSAACRRPGGWGWWSGRWSRRPYSRRRSWAPWVGPSSTSRRSGLRRSSSSSASRGPVLNRGWSGTGLRAGSDCRRRRSAWGRPCRRRRPGGSGSGCRGRRPGWSLHQGPGTQFSSQGPNKSGSYKEHKSGLFKDGKRCHHEWGI